MNIQPLRFMHTSFIHTDVHFVHLQIQVLLFIPYKFTANLPWYKKYLNFKKRMCIHMYLPILKQSCQIQSLFMILLADRPSFLNFRQSSLICFQLNLNKPLWRWGIDGKFILNCKALHACTCTCCVHLATFSNRGFSSALVLSQ